MGGLVHGMLALLDPDVGRTYSGPIEAAPQHVVAEPSPARPDPAPPVPAKPTAEAKPVVPTRAPTPVDEGTRWRIAGTVGAHAFAGGSRIGEVGVGFGGFIGAGVPAKQRPRLRIRHAFGYAGDVSVGTFGDIYHSHRFAASGLVGSTVPIGRRQIALYYFGSLGASFFRPIGNGPTVGVRIGVASSKQLDYIVALGCDLVTLIAPAAVDLHLVPVVYLSAVTFGRL